MTKGFIVGNISNIYEVEYNDKIYKCLARGKIKIDDISPVVGDYVELEITDDEKKEAIIQKVLDRKVYIKRPKVANLTQIILVVSLKSPKPDLLLLDKQLAYAQYIGIKPIICINKIDLDDKEAKDSIKKLYEKIGYKVIETNAKQKDGVNEIIDILEGNITALSGNSGVGKSTLINAIHKKDVTLEGDISKKNKKGKNTTTFVKLYKINNGYIADTPGFSTFEIEEIQSKDLEKYFIDFRNHINNCEFIGCSHIKEEGCGVKKAVEENKISKDRYNRFVKIYEELKYKEARKW